MGYGGTQPARNGIVAFYPFAWASVASAQPPSGPSASPYRDKGDAKSTSIAPDALGGRHK